MVLIVSLKIILFIPRSEAFILFRSQEFIISQIPILLFFKKDLRWSMAFFVFW